MKEPDPAIPPPLTFAHDFVSTAESLAIVVLTLTSELHMLCWSYNFLSGELTHTQNLFGSTNEAWRVKRQLQQDLDKCVNSNIHLIQRLDDQNLVIASLRKQIEACERKHGAVGIKDLHSLLHLSLHSSQISNSMFCFRRYITA